MAIAKHNGDWLADDFGDELHPLLQSFGRGFALSRWHDPMCWGYKYGLSRVVGPNQGKVPIGVFDSPQEVVAMIKLILASEEHDGRR